MSTQLNLFPDRITLTDCKKAGQVKGYHLFNQAEWPNNGYFHLHSIWNDSVDLPAGYNYYIVSWHMEQIDFDWLKRQKVDATIVVLIDFYEYNADIWPDNVVVVRWIYWHYAIDQLCLAFGTTYTKDIKYKVSALCKRITQSKLLVTTAILEYLDKKDSLLSLHDVFEDKNVHGWGSTGNTELDEIQNLFRQKYLGSIINMDDFVHDQHYHYHIYNPAQIAYQQAALHFTNESFHYSLMDHGRGPFITPGPHLTEKTFKCLLGGTAFISVGQFDVYRALGELGMKFDYGLDLSFDQDPGNITRLIKLIELVKTLNNYTAQELFEMTKASSLHNQDLIASGEFYQTCESLNQKSLSQILKIIC